MTVEGWLRKDNFPAMLNNTNTRNEADLINVCPVYKAMVHLQSVIDKILGNQGMEHLVVIMTLAMITIFVSMKWRRLGTDSITSGFLRNPFLWGSCDEETTNAL